MRRRGGGPRGGGRGRGPMGRGPMGRGFGRRQPFGRFLIPPPLFGNRREALPDKVHKELRRANQLSEQGDHLNAAVIFERLANKALDRGMLRQGPMLLLQAAQAYILAEEIDKGIDLSKQGFGYLAEAQRWEKIRILGTRAVSTLTDAGYKTEAEDMNKWLDQLMSAGNSKFGNANLQKGKLPAKCPYCGAPIRSDEVSWIDNNTAECVYCGSAVPTK